MCKYLFESLLSVLMCVYPEVKLLDHIGCSCLWTVEHFIINVSNSKVFLREKLQNIEYSWLENTWASSTWDQASVDKVDLELPLSKTLTYKSHIQCLIGF